MPQPAYELAGNAGYAETALSTLLSQEQKQSLMDVAKKGLAKNAKKPGLDAGTLIFVAAALANEGAWQLQMEGASYETCQKHNDRLKSSDGAYEAIKKNLASAYIDFTLPLQSVNKKVVESAFKETSSLDAGGQGRG